MRQILTILIATVCVAIFPQTLRAQYHDEAVEDSLAVVIDDDEEQEAMEAEKDDEIDGEEYYQQAMKLLNSEDEDDRNLASIYLILSAEAGYPEAMVAVGSILLMSDDEDSKSNGFDYMLAAAEKGDSMAAQMVALCYKEGHGVKASERQWKYWADKAKELGYEGGQTNTPAQTSYYYTAQTTTAVNFRKGPSTSSALIRQLPKGSSLFINKDELSNGYYKALSIDDDEMGYVHQKYVKFLEKVEVDDSGSLKIVQTINSPYAELNLKNDTGVKITVKIAGATYTMAPNTTKKNNA